MDFPHGKVSAQDSCVIPCHSDTEYDNAIAAAGNRLIVVDCYADWCGPCRAIAPTFAQLSTEYNHIAFIKLDVTSCPLSSKSLNIMAMPTFVFFQNGKRVGSFMGASESLLIKGLENEGKVSICSNCAIC
jgi:thioredoxin 1